MNMPDKVYLSEEHNGAAGMWISERIREWNQIEYIRADLALEPLEPHLEMPQNAQDELTKFLNGVTTHNGLCGFCFEYRIHETIPKLLEWFASREDDGDYEPPFYAQLEKLNEIALLLYKMGFSAAVSGINPPDELEPKENE